MEGIEEIYYLYKSFIRRIIFVYYVGVLKEDIDIKDIVLVYKDIFCFYRILNGRKVYVLWFSLYIRCYRVFG